MSTLSVRIPDSYHSMIKDLAVKDKISINQFIVAAIGEKISALKTEDYIAQKSKSATRENFLSVLSKVPNTEPDEFDK